MAAPTTDRPVTDRFDSVPEDLHRVGSHRAKAHWGRGWVGVGWSVLAIVALTGGGLWGLAQVNPDFKLELPFQATGETPAPPAETTGPVAAEPVLNPNLAITILNGTPTQGLSTTVGDYLVTQGWDGAAFGVGARVSASSSDIKITQVIYNDPANEGAARALLETLGVGEILMANTYPAAPLAVVIGSDFVVPAG